MRCSRARRFAALRRARRSRRRRVGDAVAGCARASRYELLEPRDARRWSLLAPLLARSCSAVARRSAAGRSACSRCCCASRSSRCSRSGSSRLARTDDDAEGRTVVLVDVTDSVPDAALEDARARGRAALRAQGAEDDVLKLVTLRARPRAVPIEQDDEAALPQAARSARHDARPSAGATGAGHATSQAALQLAYGLFPPGYLKRVVLLSDGVQTDGDVLAEANRARELRGAALHASRTAARRRGEVARARAARCRTRCDVGETFEVTRRHLREPRDHGARAALPGRGAQRPRRRARPRAQAGRQRGQVQERRARRRRGDLRARARATSPTTSSRENNRFAVDARRAGPPAGALRRGPAAARAATSSSALTAQQFDVDVRAPAALPALARELERYDFVILSDVPREAVSLAAQDSIEQLRARPRRRLPVRRRRGRLRPRRLGPHARSSASAGAHGRRAPQGDARASRWRWSSTAPAR